MRLHPETCHQVVYPHMGDWRATDIPRTARKFDSPPLAYPARKQKGFLPSSMTLIELVDPFILVTSVQAEGDKIICRVYAAYGRNATAEAATRGLQAVGLRLIDGSLVDELHPFQTGKLIL